MLTTDEIIDYYFKENHEQFAKETKRIYNLSLRQFFAYCPKSFETVTSKDIRAWLAELDHQGQKPRTINFKLAALKSLYAFGYEENLVTKNPALMIKWAQIDDSLPHYLDKATLARLFELTNNSLLERAILEALYSTGVRISELLNIREDDIDWETRKIWIREGKGNKERFVLFTTECATRLNEYLKKRIVTSPYIFVNRRGKPLSSSFVRKRFQEYTKALEPESKITPHTIRHTFGAHLAEKGMPLSYIQELLGHINSNTTKIYTRLFTDARKKQYDSFQ